MVFEKSQLRHTNSVFCCLILNRMIRKPGWHLKTSSDRGTRQVSATKYLCAGTGWMKGKLLPLVFLLSCLWVMLQHIISAQNLCGSTVLIKNLPSYTDQLNSFQTQAVLGSSITTLCIVKLKAAYPTELRWLCVKPPPVTSYGRPSLHLKQTILNYQWDNSA